MEFDRGTVAMYGGLLMGVLGVVRKGTEKETTNCCWVVVGPVCPLGGDVLFGCLF